MSVSVSHTISKTLLEYPYYLVEYPYYHVEYPYYPLQHPYYPVEYPYPPVPQYPTGYGVRYFCPEG